MQEPLMIDRPLIWSETSLLRKAISASRVARAVSLDQRADPVPTALGRAYPFQVARAIAGKPHLLVRLENDAAINYGADYLIAFT